MLLKLKYIYNFSDKEVYQPGWLNAEDIVSNAKYSGFITSLRLTVEAAIDDAIEDLKELLNNRIASNEFSFEVHVAISAERKEQVDYRIHALEEKLDHKSNRLFNVWLVDNVPPEYLQSYKTL